LLDSLDRAASGSLRRDQVFECDRKKISLIGADFGSLFSQNVLKEIDHIIESFSLLGDTGKEDVLLYAHIQI